MATMYATYKDLNNNLNQVTLTTSAKNDLIYSVLDIGGNFGYYAWRDASTPDRIVIKRINLLNGDLYTFEASGNQYITLTGAIDPIMLCLTRDGNTLYISPAGQSKIAKFTNVQSEETGNLPTKTADITTCNSNIYAMKINKSGYLTTVQASNKITQLDTTNSDAVIGTANRVITLTGLGGFYVNIPMYFEFTSAGVENIICPLQITSSGLWAIYKISQSDWSVTLLSSFNTTRFQPYCSTNAHRYGADLITDVYGHYWLSHLSNNGLVGGDTTTGDTAYLTATINSYKDFITTTAIYVLLSNNGVNDRITIKKNNSGGSVIYDDAILWEGSGYPYYIDIFDFFNMINIRINYLQLASTNKSITITFGERAISEVIKITPTASSKLVEKTISTDTDKNLCLINNLGADSTGAIYYSYVENLASTEVNGRIFRYRSDGGTSTITATNLETYLNRSYCLTNRNDMTAYDLSTDGCAGR